MYIGIILFAKIALSFVLYITATVNEDGKGKTCSKKTVVKRGRKPQTCGKKGGVCIKV